MGWIHLNRFTLAVSTDSTVAIVNERSTDSTLDSTAFSSSLHPPRWLAVSVSLCLLCVNCASRSSAARPVVAIATCPHSIRMLSRRSGAGVAAARSAERQVNRRLARSKETKLQCAAAIKHKVSECVFVCVRRMCLVCSMLDVQLLARSLATQFAVRFHQRQTCALQVAKPPKPPPPAEIARHIHTHTH